MPLGLADAQVAALAGALQQARAAGTEPSDAAVAADEAAIDALEK